MYLPDLASYPYAKHLAISIGWLDSSHEYTQGEVPQTFIERLLHFCDNPVFITMGAHDCEFCQSAYGSGVIWVFGSDEAYYVAPDMIHHYVISHQYRPPDEFIQALMACPLPDSPEYQSQVMRVR